MMMYVAFFFQQNKSSLPKTKLLLFPPHASDDTVPGSWHHVQYYTEWTIKSSQSVLQEICSSRFLNVHMNDNRVWFLSVHSRDRDMLTGRTVRFGIEQNRKKKKDMLASFSEPETSSQTIKPSIFSKCFPIKELNLWHAKGNTWNIQAGGLMPLLTLSREIPELLTTARKGKTHSFHILL